MSDSGGATHEADTESKFHKDEEAQYDQEIRFSVFTLLMFTFFVLLSPRWEN